MMIFGSWFLAERGGGFEADEGEDTEHNGPGTPPKLEPFSVICVVSGANL